MKERSKSLTTEDTIPVVSPLPMPRKRKATTISRSLALRLSLDVDQHYSSSGITHSSSGFSNGTNSDFLKKGDHDDEDDTASSISSSQPLPRNSLMNPSSDHYQKLRLSSIETTTPPPSSPDLKKDALLQQQQQQQRSHRVIPLVIPEIDTSKDQQSQTQQQPLKEEQEEDDDDSSDYGDLIKEFRLPSEKLPHQQNKVAMSKTTSTSTSSTATSAVVVITDVQKNKEIVKEVTYIYPTDNIKENNKNNHNINTTTTTMNTNSNVGSPTPFVSRSTITANELSRQKAMETLEGHFSALEPTGSKSMDIVRDKAHYDAVVAGTLHRRPWTQYLRAQSESKEDKDKEEVVVEKDGEEFHPQQTTIGQKERDVIPANIPHHPTRSIKTASAVFADYNNNSKIPRPSSFVFYPPSPNSINSNY
ncbi:hypothetical protein BDA99DRAFT_169263 [Phascolomyces articulosus]|uniref:Uncharacterized protein n=1 Tax=Phascolomyces articulosus TaxID=60185 RepID=A0AAD5PAT1_9FUNG|nr:hypothetical protein BDA99DRAFT_169263 [Phascolomyces articulosus]